MIGWAALAFAAGYGPRLAAQASGGGSPPIGRADVNAVASAVGPLFDQIVPIVAGFKTPSTAWLGISGWFAWPLALAIGAALIALRERPFTPFFHLLLFAAPVMFLLSGAFVDAQSYRYLMPAAGALAVVLALGVWRLFRWSRLAGAVALAAILGLFGAGQLAWYRQLAPDVRSPELIACLDRAGVRAAVADYWLSYKLTFISGERIIVAPENGVDRYPPYTAHVRAQRSAPRVPEDAALSCDRSTSAPR